MVRMASRSVTGEADSGACDRGDPRTRVRRRITVSGRVQGVGFRPFVWRLATRLGLVGSVENIATGVAIEVAGPREDVRALVEGLSGATPPLAVVTAVTVEDSPTDPQQDPPATEAQGFVILDRRAAAPRGVGAVSGILVPPDVAACPACLAEVGDPADRRHRYPFTNCTDCGPRYSIIERLPYDRGTTTMRGFAMCDRCDGEYRDPASRRFHAQPNACPDCGPTCSFLPSGPAGFDDVAPCTGADAIAAAREALLRGAIVAVKGIGGYRLACDATDAEAVERLRVRKRRPSKPLAVLVADVAAVRRLARCDEQERLALESAERPIVLLSRDPARFAGAETSRASPIADAVAAATATLGVMLPDAPLHHLLCEGLPPLVMTSGNVADEPIVHDDAAALDRLAGVADAVLRHDRPIHAPCDDSVVRCMAGVAVPLRRSRGAVPLVVPLGNTGPDVLAIGGDLKAAPCVTRGALAICGAHVGDLGSVATLGSLERAVDHLLCLTGARPLAVAVDLHPGWISTAWARRWAAARGVPIVAVQHHEAHVASLVAEQGGVSHDQDGPWIAVCFDGTGFGHDGTIRGGEIFVVERDAVDPAAFQPRRIAALEACAMPGGDAAAREPWRAALGVLHAAGVAWDARLPPVRAAGDRAAVIASQLAHGRAVPRVGTMGRLFDAVASLAGVRQVNLHEAEAAMDLESLARTPMPCVATGVGYRFGVDGIADAPDAGLVVTWRDLVRAVAADVLAGVQAAVIAGRFHAAVARMVGDVCVRIRASCGGRVVGLTGGCFQNAALTEAVVAVLRQEGFAPAIHHRVPPNDGGLALGQAVLARGRLMAAAPRET